MIKKVLYSVLLVFILVVNFHGKVYEGEYTDKDLIFALAKDNNLKVVFFPKETSKKVVVSRIDLKNTSQVIEFLKNLIGYAGYSMQEKDGVFFITGKKRHKCRHHQKKYKQRKMTEKFPRRHREGFMKMEHHYFSREGGRKGHFKKRKDISIALAPDKNREIVEEKLSPTPRMERITLNVERIPVTKVFEMIGRMIGKKIAYNKRIDDIVSYKGENVHYKIVLKEIAEKIGAKVIEAENEIIIEK